MSKEEADLLIPQKYSRRVFFNIPLLLLLGWTAHRKQFTLVKYVTPFLLVSSWIHWNRLKRGGVVRKIDWILAILMVLSITSYEKRFRRMDRYLWRFSICLQLFMVCYNSARFTLETDQTYSPIFYTKSGTTERENAYKRCVYTHMLFVHMLPGLSATFAIQRSLQRSLQRS